MKISPKVDDSYFLICYIKCVDKKVPKQEVASHSFDNVMIEIPAQTRKQITEIAK
jgi:hypothetical protein